MIAISRLWPYSIASYLAATSVFQWFMTHICISLVGFLVSYII